MRYLRKQANGLFSQLCHSFCQLSGNKFQIHYNTLKAVQLQNKFTSSVLVKKTVQIPITGMNSINITLLCFDNGGWVKVLGFILLNVPFQ